MFEVELRVDVVGITAIRCANSATLIGCCRRKEAHQSSS
jgi:hypothetical protein